MDGLSQLLAKLSVREQELAEHAPVKVNPGFLGIPSREHAFDLFTLEPTSAEFKRVCDRFANKKQLKVDSIDRVDNPYLKKAFELKQEERRKRRKAAIAPPMLLFHGTDLAAAGAICSFNFDWRKVKRCRYGRGVSFATDSAYAADYSDTTSLLKVMMVAEVSNTRACFGGWGAKLPPPKFDSTCSEDGTVIVKYDDCDFYPAYVIYYHVLPKAVAGKKKKKKYKLLQGKNKRSPQKFSTFATVF